MLALTADIRNEVLVQFNFWWPQRRSYAVTEELKSFVDKRGKVSRYYLSLVQEILKALSPKLLRAAKNEGGEYRPAEACRRIQQY
jgi:hypothetical protein